MRQIAFKLEQLQSVIIITNFSSLKINNYSNKLQKKKPDFLSFHSVKKHLWLSNCHVNIHEPLALQPTRARDELMHIL